MEKRKKKKKMEKRKKKKSELHSRRIKSFSFLLLLNLILSLSSFFLPSLFLSVFFPLSDRVSPCSCSLSLPLGGLCIERKVGSTFRNECMNHELHFKSNTTSFVVSVKSHSLDITFIHFIYACIEIHRNVLYRNVDTYMLWMCMKWKLYDLKDSKNLHL